MIVRAPCALSRVHVTHANDAPHIDWMTTSVRGEATLPTLDEPTRRLVRLAAIIAVADEQSVRASLADAAENVTTPWIEELILQSYLLCGFPRTLNAMREWRRLTGNDAPRMADG